MTDKLKVIWPDAKTLGQTVYEMIKAGNAGSKEFQEMVRFFGDNKLKKLYEEEVEKRKKS